MLRVCSIASVSLLVFLITRSPAAEPARFPLADGDVWVMAGDSITAQHLHTNYFEAFCYARYPKLKFAFRNAGVGGHTIPNTLSRFDSDIAAWKPTVVSVELGMNDANTTPPDEFVKNMGTMVERIRKVGARPVMFSASPVNDGTLLAKATGRNLRLSEYAKSLKEFSEKEKLPYADQFHALVDVWGKNKPRENMLATIADLKLAASDDSLSGVEHLRAFLAAQEKAPAKGVNLAGDPVHPGPPGQLMMAATLLKSLGAEGFVSSVSVDAEAGQVDAKGCLVTGLRTSATSVSFDRLDECLPFPIADDARPALMIAPEVLELSQYTVKITGLKVGEYQLRIGGVGCGRFNAKQLAEGINLTTIGSSNAKAKLDNPIVAQMRAILAAVAEKEAIVGKPGMMGTWRGVAQKAFGPKSDQKAKDTLATLTMKVEAADAKIREAAKPKTIHFDIVPIAGK
ncbi:MAG: hypothetical protein C0467_01485 [Planctomycetaceae bacterium]|nr:hypothetical protein [Planctomycetaceae bacterium]